MTWSADRQYYNNSSKSVIYGTVEIVDLDPATGAYTHNINVCSEDSYQYCLKGRFFKKDGVRFFNEPENYVDYALAVGLRRWGYSYDNGNESVSVWSFELKPICWSVSIWKLMYGVELGVGWGINFQYNLF